MSRLYVRIGAGLVLLVGTVLALGTKYAGDFEELGASARSVGMGSAFVAVGQDPSALYYNPSASAFQDQRSVALMHAENFGGLVKSDFASVMLPAGRSSIGFGLLHNGVSGIKLTELPNPSLPVGVEYTDTTILVRDTLVGGDSLHAGDTLIASRLNTPFITKTVAAADWVLYFNYARAVNPHLLLGGNAKLIYRTTGVSTAYGMGLDLGATVVVTRDFNIGLRVRNLTTSPLFWDTRTRESMGPRAALGLGKAFVLGKDHRFLVDIEAEGNLEGLPIEENLGFEYQYRNMLKGRLGFHRGNFTFGLGGEYKRFFVDYAYETAAYADARDLPPSQKIAGGVKF